MILQKVMWTQENDTHRTALDAGEVAQKVGALAALQGDLDSRFPASTWLLTSHLLTPVSRDLIPSSGLHQYQAPTWYTDTWRQANHTHKTIRF